MVWPHTFYKIIPANRTSRGKGSPFRLALIPPGGPINRYNFVEYFWPLPHSIIIIPFHLHNSTYNMYQYNITYMGRTVKLHQVPHFMDPLTITIKQPTPKIFSYILMLSGIFSVVLFSISRFQEKKYFIEYEPWNDFQL